MNTKHHLLRTWEFCTASLLRDKPPLSNQKEGVHLEQYTPRITKVHLDVDLPRDHSDTDEPKFNPTCTIVHCTTWDTSMFRVQYRTWPKTLGHWCKGGTPPGKRRRSPAALHHPHQYTLCPPMHTNAPRRVPRLNYQSPIPITHG